MRILLILAVVFFSGCAHWEAMTQEQKNIAVATTVAGLVIGALVSDDGGNNNIHHHHCTHNHGNSHKGCD